MKFIIKHENIYMSKLLLKFINAFLFTNLKIKIEKLVYYSFFYWKKQSNNLALFYLFEALFKIRPLIGFYIYIIKTKQTKKIKIRPYFMPFEARWQKAIYWFSRSIKMENQKQSFLLTVSDELYNVTQLDKSSSLSQKIKYYKTILSFKTSKNYTW